MEKILIQFNCQIIRILPDGFNAILEEENYIVKFRDKIIPFKVNDFIAVSIENVEKERREYIADGNLLIYVVISSFISNGFLFKDTREKEGFFWRSTRGMLTYKMFEINNVYKQNDLLKIHISKIG